MDAVTVSFAEQRAFAAQVAKEKSAAEWAMHQSDEEQKHNKPRKRVRPRKTRDGQNIFAVTFFDGDKPKRTDWLALDSRREAEFGAEEPERGSLRYRLRQLKELSVSRSEPCLSTSAREQQAVDEQASFQAVFPLPPKGAEMRKETATDQSTMFMPRPETVALSPVEKREMKLWGLDVNAVSWQDGSQPPPWVTAVGNTNNKWANREMSLRAAREERDFLESLQAAMSSRCPGGGAASDQKNSQPFPRWVKDLPPVREGRKQLANRKIIPFLDQHAYPAGGVAEAKRARRREKKAFLATVTRDAFTAAEQQRQKRQQRQERQNASFYPGTVSRRTFSPRGWVQKSRKTAAGVIKDQGDYCRVPSAIARERRERAGSGDTRCAEDHGVNGEGPNDVLATTRNSLSSKGYVDILRIVGEPTDPAAEGRGAGEVVAAAAATQIVTTTLHYPPTASVDDDERTGTTTNIAFSHSPASLFANENIADDASYDEAFVAGQDQATERRHGGCKPRPCGPGGNESDEDGGGKSAVVAPDSGACGGVPRGDARGRGEDDGVGGHVKGPPRLLEQRHEGSPPVITSSVRVVDMGVEL